MKIGQSSFIHFLSNLLKSVVGFIAVLYFARVLGAESLDTYFLIIAVLAWLKMFGTMGIRTAVAKRISEGAQQGQFFLAGAAMQIFLIALLSAGIFVFRRPLADYVGGDYVWLVIAMFLAASTSVFLRAVLRGQNLVHMEGVLTLTDKLSQSLIQMFLLFVGYSIAGLLLGYVIGSLIAVVIGVVVVLVRFRSIDTEFRLPTKENARSIVSYGKYSWLTGVQSRTFSWIDVVILGIFIPAGAGAVSIYTVSWRIAALFVVFSSAVLSALFPHISRKSSEGEDVGSLINDGLTYTGLLIIPGFVGGVLVGDRVLLLYGEEFVRGAWVLVILILARLVYSYQKQLIWALNAVDRPDISFRINAIFVAVNVVLNLVLIYLYGMAGAAVATGLSAVITLALGYKRTSEIVDFTVPYGEIARQWTAAGIMGVSVLVILGFAGSMGWRNPTVLSVTVPVGAGVYFVALYIISSRFRSVVVGNVPFEVPDSLR